MKYEPKIFMLLIYIYVIQVLPHVAYIVQFITTIAQDNERSDGSIAASAGLIG